jgi:hypothetical protein
MNWYDAWQSDLEDREKLLVSFQLQGYTIRQIADIL